MGRKTPFQIICLIAFVAFAAVSCYLTVGSIHLSMPAIPIWCMWIAVVGLFVLTSYGTKMIMDSFNRNLMIENPTKKFVGGLIIVLVTWLLISFPTNSHSLFYNKNARDYAKKVKEVKSAQKALENEIKQPERIGFGDRADSCLQNVEKALDIKVGTIVRLTNKDRSQKGINSAIKYYDNQIRDHLEILSQQYETQWDIHKVNFKKEAKKLNVLISNIELNVQALDRATLSNQDALLAQSRDLIQTAKSTLEARGLSAEYKGYPSERLINVTEVWTDYMKGKFSNENSGMIYWILLSLVIDLAAFCFFNVAFKQEE